jgi:hypothetical protein
MNCHRWQLTACRGSVDGCGARGGSHGAEGRLEAADNGEILGGKELRRHGSSHGSTTAGGFARGW